MSTSEQYLNDLVRESEGTGPQDWGAAVRTIHDEHGDKAAGILARAFNHARRTGERWIAKATDKINPKTGQRSQASEPKPMEQVHLVAWAQRHDAVKKLRNATTVNAGNVAVYSKSAMTKDPRTRNVGTLNVTGSLRAALDAAADLVEAGNLAAAADRIDDAVMDAYGEQRGNVADLSETLGVTDYRDGFSIG
jgi:hypothetical protein